MDSKFQDTDSTLADALKHTIHEIKAESITLHDLLMLIGEQGLLLFCILITLPFLLPVSIPGVSTVFGIVIILIGIGVTLNRVPWLPTRLMNHAISRASLAQVLENAVKIFGRIERWVKPRLQGLTTGALINRINGLALTFGGILLLFPLGLVPFSNTLPALAILLLAVGMLQRDGYAIVGGYLALVTTTIYFGALALAVVVGGQTLLLN